MGNDAERKAKVNDREDHFLHVHTFLTEADVADDHQHVILGVTGPSCDLDDSHVHRIRTRTSFIAEDGTGHWHWADVMTGPALEMPDCTHTHYYCGTTSYDDGHCHTFSDVTGLAHDQMMFDDDEDDCEDYDPPKHHHKHKRPDEK